MSSLTYQGLLNKTIELYMHEGSMSAYRFVSEHADEVLGNKAQIYNFRYALASASGLEEEGLNLMREAVLDKGYWYEYEYLLEDDDLKPLHKYDEFHRLVNLCKEREQQAKRSQQPDMKIKANQQGVDSCVIALHGNQENIEITEPYWSTVTDANTVLALPQSSQIEFSEGFVWDDIAKGTEELKDHYDKIAELYGLTGDQVIIGGFSAGARVALNAILAEQIAVKGFIFVAPWLPEIEEWDTLLEKLKKNNIKGYVICGDQDEDSYECSTKFAKLLEKYKIDHNFKVIEELNHEYPPQFDRMLHQAVTYIRQ